MHKEIIIGDQVLISWYDRSSTQGKILSEIKTWSGQIMYSIEEIDENQNVRFRAYVSERLRKI